MSSNKDYLDFILEQLSDLDGITFRAMMGEYILCYRDRLSVFDLFPRTVHVETVVSLSKVIIGD